MHDVLRGHNVNLPIESGEKFALEFLTGGQGHKIMMCALVERDFLYEGY